MCEHLRHILLALALTAVARAADKSGYTVTNPTPRGLLRDLSTDRPDQTESPYTVDAGHWQLEMDFFCHTRDHDTEGDADAFVREWSIAPVNLKLGLTNRVDVQLMFDPQVRTRTEDRVADTVTTMSDVGDVTTRLKLNVWGNDGGPTALAVMPFVKWPLSANDVRNGDTEGGVIVILGYELPAGWNSAVMTEVDFVSDGAGGRNTEWLNSITFGRDLSDRIGVYWEFVAVTGDAPGFDWRGQLDCGFTYGLADDSQFDLGCNFGVTDSAPDFQPFVGFSRRL
jgi:hypothetical protein